MTKLSEIKTGDVLEADGGFDCMDEGTRYTVEEDDAALFVNCREGKHYLDGQVDVPGGDLVGLHRVAEHDRS